MEKILPNKLVLGDCLEEMQRIPDMSCDLLCTDPPYLTTARGNNGNSGGMLAQKLTMKGKIFANNNIKIEQWLPECYRILKDGTHAYIMTNNANLIHYLKIIDDSDFHFIRLLVWDKRMKIMGNKYMTQTEFIIMLSKGKDRYINNCGCSDILSVPIHKLKDKSGHNLHDTEKPVELMQILISNSTNEGDVVLDPFMGIGATPIAAKKIKRRYIGIEIDKGYFDIACKRVKEVENNPTLF